MSIKKEIAKQEEVMQNWERQLIRMREEKAQNALEIVKECSDYFFTENGFNGILRVGDLITTDHKW